MRNTNRLIALALCFTLTLGAFVYKPPEAKAVAVVDDAVVIGALLAAFAGGCGLVFANNGMTSGEIADGMMEKWTQFKDFVGGVDQTFSEWLGYEDTTALVQALAFEDGKLFIPRAVARKLADFTDWLTSDVGVVSGSNKSVFSASNLTYVGEPVEIGQLSVAYAPNNRIYEGLDSFVVPGSSYTQLVPPGGGDASTLRLGRYHVRLKKDYSRQYFSCSVDGGLTFSDWIDGGEFNYQRFLAYDAAGVLCFVTNYHSYEDLTFYLRPLSVVFYDWFYRCNLTVDSSDFAYLSTDFSAGTLDGVQTPDLADDAETAPTPTITGVGWDAATIEELLQQILDQLQANTLATTIAVDAAQTGGETGTDTDEDAKPYLPFIPQIFEKVKEIPGTLSNIWDTVKGLPAAIAEKISAFFTTLWGWLQDIITEIKALPAAIAEKVKALFVPHEGYAAEFVADITSTYQGRMGLLTYPFTVLADFVGTVATLEEQEPILRWDAVEWQNKTVIAAGEYNLKSAVNSAQMQTVYTIYKTVVSGVLVVAFLHLCYKKLKEVQHN